LVACLFALESFNEVVVAQEAVLFDPVGIYAKALDDKFRKTDAYKPPSFRLMLIKY
jgi:hypothetical protein